VIILKEINKLLYAINTSLNEIIKRTLNGKAVAVIDPGKSYEHVYPFVQCHETNAGLIVSAGYDEYTPSSAMHMIRGEINVAPETEQITITADDGLRAIIREATEDQARTHAAYLGDNTPEDQARIAKHIKSIENAATDEESN
jgi:hypothetical protein